jgi:D-inositol-3-phosphate glycosyltransferase
VVANAVGGLRTLVRHDRTGFLVEGRDPGAFAQRIDELFDNPHRAEAMGRAATAEALRYSWSTTAGRLRRLYADLGVRAPVSCG